MACDYFFHIDGPLMTKPARGTMKACGFFQGIERLVNRHGGGFFRVIERHGIDPADVHGQDGTVRCTSAAEILDDCSRRFDDRLFGLRLGSYLQADVYGALTTYARAAPDLHRSIQVLLEYMPVVYCPDADVEFVIEGDSAEFRWRPYPGFESGEQASYFGQAQVLVFMKSLIGQDFRPSEVRLVPELWHRDAPRAERFFGCRVRGNSPANSIRFPARLLGERNASANAMLFGLLGSYFAQVRKASGDSFMDEIRCYVRDALASGDCSIERCASKIEASARTIQRRLREHDRCFSDIVEEERVGAARRALMESADSLADIAFNLGYSDQSSFGRAFKRWTGQTPRAFREGNPHR